MEIIFPEIADNAPPDEVHAWYCEVDRILNEILERSKAMEKAAKKKATKKKATKKKATKKKKAKKKKK